VALAYSPASVRTDGAQILEQESATLSKLAEALVALANADGGVLYLGLEPGSRKTVGLADPVAALDRAVQAALAAEPPLIIPLPERIDVGGRSVVAVTVPRGLPHVYSYRGRYLLRDTDRNRPIDPRELRRLMMERGTAGFEATTPDDAKIEDLDWDKVGQHLARVGGLPGLAPAETLLRRGCVVRLAGKLRPTNAGLLLFGRDPQRWVRSSEILAVRYPGTTMGDQFIREVIQGTLPEQIRQAEAFVVSNLRRGVRLDRLERSEETEYPPQAVREAVVNAVAHRDYQIRGDEIRIMLFSDRLEVYSPGRLPGHVTVSNLVDERFSRNEAIVQVLCDLGFIERLGYGIDRMLRLLAEAGLPPPRFEETAGGFQVTLFGHGPSLLSEWPDARRWRHLGLNERQELALEFLSKRGRITNRDFQELCEDISPETIRRDLADLVRKNLLLKIGEKRATYYILK